MKFFMTFICLCWNYFRPFVLSLCLIGVSERLPWQHRSSFYTVLATESLYVSRDGSIHCCHHGWRSAVFQINYRLSTDIRLISFSFCCKNTYCLSYTQINILMEFRSFIELSNDIIAKILYVRFSLDSLD